MPALATTQTGRSAVRFPQGRRSPRGRVRWYPVHVPDGREDALCERVRQLIDPELLEDAFVPYKERWFKRSGVWQLEPVRMYREYIFVATHDVRALDKALARLSSPLSVCGTEDRAYAPLADDAMAWLAQVMDARHVVCGSVAVIEDGVLRVTQGPLVGQEARICEVDRHHRRCTVRISDADGGFTEQLALEVPHKS